MTPYLIGFEMFSAYLDIFYGRDESQMVFNFFYRSCHVSYLFFIFINFRFQTYKEIREFIMIREDKGSERLLPVRIRLSDGIVVSMMNIITFYSH